MGYILAVSIEIEYWEEWCCFSLVVCVSGAGSIVKRLCWCVSRSAVLSILGVVITRLRYVWDATVRYGSGALGRAIQGTK